jgi:hypothetical protein
VLRIRIQDPGLGAFLTPGSGIPDPEWVESQHPDPVSGLNNPDHIFQNSETIFFGGGVKILKFFDEDPGSGMETVRIRDPGWRQFGSGIRDGDSSDPGSGNGKKSDPESGINIPDPQH